MMHNILSNSVKSVCLTLVATVIICCACYHRVILVETADGFYCGCTAKHALAMFGPNRGKRSPIPRSPQLPPSRTSTDSDTIRIDDMLIPRAEFERAASPGTGRFSAPSDYINCVRPWPNGVLRYRFEITYPNSYKNLIRQSLATLQSRTGNAVTFVEADYFINQPHVTIIDSDGCWSYVGKVYSYSSQDLSLAVPGCMLESIIQHEFIHALGFYHEQSRYDRDSYVNIMWNNIESDSCTNFHKNSYLIPSGFPSYDHDSIMHYTSYFFACNRSAPTLVKKDGSTIDMRTNLTDYDVAKLMFVYSSSNLKYCSSTPTYTTRSSSSSPMTTSTSTVTERSKNSATRAMEVPLWVIAVSAAVPTCAVAATIGSTLRFY